jgi:CheY-like chemotaxis protein
MARILVIDESLAMRRLLRFMLKGHEVIEARFGLEGLGSVGAGPFDLIICDIALTDMAAESFYQHLVEAGYLGRLLFLASRLDMTPRDQFGARLPVLFKPIDAEMLMAKVEAMLIAPAPYWDVK